MCMEGRSGLRFDWLGVVMPEEGGSESLNYILELLRELPVRKMFSLSQSEFRLYLRADYYC